MKDSDMSVLVQPSSLFAVNLRMLTEFMYVVSVIQKKTTGFTTAEASAELQHLEVFYNPTGTNSISPSVIRPNSLSTLPFYQTRTVKIASG